MSNRQMRLGLEFDIDKSGNLKQLKQDLSTIQNMSEFEFKYLNRNRLPTDQIKSELKSVQDMAAQVEIALQKSYNAKLDSVNIVEFRKQLSNVGLDLNKIQSGFRYASDVGTNAFQELTTTLLSSKKELKQTYSIVDKLGETFVNTLKWTITSGVLNTITGSIQKMWNYTQKLDSSLNDIRIVTGKSADEMDRFARKANAAAKTLSASTTAYTNASLIYYQQGLGDEDVEARTEVTIKAANVTGQSAAEVSDQLTAVWNGYRVVAKEAELYVDKLAAVAATTAADLEELSEGMSKVASAANTMGVDVDQLSAQLATIVSVTREDASAVGTALKTIYARMGDLSVDGVDEFGVSLGDVSGQMKQMGIEVLDQNGNLRDMGTVMEEVAAKWNKWTDAQKQAAAVAMAGKRQYNNLMALFENWDMYESALSTSKNSKGTLQAQQDIYAESLEAHLTKLSTAGEKFYDAFMDSDSMKKFIDGLSKIVELSAELIDSIGGGGNLLLLLGPKITHFIGKELGKELTTFIHNQRVSKENIAQVTAELDVQRELEKIKFTAEEKNAKKLIELRKQQLKVEKDLTEEQKKQNLDSISDAASAMKKLQEDEIKWAEIQDLYAAANPGFRLRNLDGTTDAENLEEEKQGLNKRIKKLQGRRSNKSQKELEQAEARVKEIDQELESQPKNVVYLTKEEALARLKSTKDSGKTLATATAAVTGAQEQYQQSQQALNNIDAKTLEERGLLNLKAPTITESHTSDFSLAEAPLNTDTVYLTASEVVSADSAAEGESFGPDFSYDYNLPIKESADDAMYSYSPSEAENAVREEAQGTEAAVTAAIKSTKEFKENEKAQKQYKIALKDSADTLKGFITVENSQAKLLSDSDKKLKEYVEENKDQLDILEKVQSEQALTSDELERYNQLVERASQLGQESSNQADASARAMEETADVYNKDLDLEKKLEEQIKRTNAERGKGQDLQNIMTLVGAVGTLVGLYQSLQNIGSIWEDEDLSKGEKTIQIIEAIVTILLTLLSVIPTVATAIKALGAVVSASAFGVILVIIGAVIGLLIAFSKESKSAAQVAAESFQDMQEAAENAQKAVEDLKGAYEDLKEELDSYKDAKLAIEDMRKGTEEWTEAVAELNQQVLDLIEQYPELAQYLTIDSNGVLGIAQEGQDALLEQQQDEISAATLDTRATALMSKTAEGNALRAEIKQKFNTNDKQEAFNQVYNKYNSDNRLFANISDKTYKALAAALRDKEKYEANGKSLTRFINSVADDNAIDRDVLAALAAKMTDDEWEDLLDHSTYSIEELAQALKDQSEELQKNFTALNANTEAIKALSYNYLYQDAISKGISDPETYAARGVTWEGQESALATVAANYTANNKENFWKEFLASYYENTNDDDNITQTLTELITDLYGPNAVLTYDIDSVKNADDFARATVATVDGQEIKGSQLYAAYYTKKVEDDTAENNQTIAEKIAEYTEKGWNSKAAFFYDYGDNTFSTETADSVGNFTKSTLDGLQFFKDDSQAQSNWEKYKEHFKEEAEKYIQNFGIGYDAAGFDKFSLDDYKNYQVIRTNAAATSGSAFMAIDELYKNYKDDSTKMLAINNALSQVTDWTDPSQWLTLQATLAKAGVIIDEDNAVWSKFIKDMTDGVKQWVANSNSVIENLATIKELTENISFGDILAEEDYDRLVNLAPAIKKMFIATADGFKLIGSSDELSKALKTSYGSLIDVKKLYEGVTELVSGKTAANDAQFDTSKGLKEFLGSYIENISGNQALWEYANVDTSTLLTNWNILNDDTIDTGSKQYLAAYNSVKAVAQSINQAIVDAQNGNLSSQAAQEYWVTSIAESWSDVLAQKEKGNLDDEVYAKAKTMFAGEMLSELGFSAAMADAWDPTELEKHVRAFRALELNYVEDLEQKIEALGQEIEAAFGKEKINLLSQKAQTTVEEAARSSSYAIAARTALFARSGEDNTNLVETTLQEAGILDTSHYYNAETNEVDAQALSALLLRLDPDSDEYTSVQNLINQLDKIAEAENEASQLWWDVVDLQIEAYDEQIDLIDKVREAAEEWREFERSLKDYDTGKLSVFGEQGAAATIKNAFEDFNSQTEGFQTTLGRLEEMEGFVDEIDNNLAETQERATSIVNARSAKEEELNNLKTEEANYYKDIKTWTEAAAVADEKLETAKDTLSNLADSQDLETAQKEYDTKKEEYDAAKAAVDTARDTLKERNNKVEEAQTQLNNASGSKAKDKANAALAEARTEADDAARDLLTKQGVLDDKEKEYLEAQNNLTNIKATKDARETAQKQKDEAEEEKKEANEALTEATNGLNKVQAKIGEVTTSIEDYDNQLKDLASDNPFYVIDESSGEVKVDYSAIEEHWEDFLSTAKEQLEELQATLQSLYEGYLDAQSELMELYDTEIEKLSTINSILSGSADLWKIVGKSAANSASTISQIYNAITNNVGSQLELAVQKWQVAQVEYDKYLEQVALDENNRSKDIEDTLLNNLSTATTDMLTYASEYLTSLADSFQATMSATVDDFIKGTTGMGLEEILEDWTLYQAQEDRYLDSINKEYGLNSLEQKFQKSIDATDSVTAQKKLNDVLKQQLSYLREKDKLSQYDLDRANAMYELTLKQIALEEAQQTANKLKMVRDASGNYTYQFVADQDQIAQAEEELEAAQNSLYNLDKDRNEALVTDYYNAYSEANEKIYAALAAGDSERAQRLEEYYFGANGLLSGIKQELGYAEQNLQDFKDIIGDDNFVSDLKKYTAAITSSDFGSLAQSMEVLVDQVAGEDGALTSFVETVGDMLTSSGTSNVLNALSDSLLTADEIAEETTELMTATDSVLRNLSLLTKEIGNLSDLLTSNAQQYQAWLESQTDTSESELSQNTEALVYNRKATEDLTALLSGIKVEGGTIIIPENQTNS